MIDIKTSLMCSYYKVKNEVTYCVDSSRQIKLKVSLSSLIEGEGQLPRDAPFSPCCCDWLEHAVSPAVRREMRLVGVSHASLLVKGGLSLPDHNDVEL